MKKAAQIFYFVCFYLALPVYVFLKVYERTDLLFQEKKIPYPFENFGLAAACGAVLWVYGILFLIQGIRSLIRRNRKNDL